MKRLAHRSDDVEDRLQIDSDCLVLDQLCPIVGAGAAEAGVFKEESKTTVLAVCDMVDGKGVKRFRAHLKVHLGAGSWAIRTITLQV